MAEKYMTIVNGESQLVPAITSSSGPSDGGKIVATGTNGRFHESMMPLGLGKTVTLIPASEDLSAGDFVNIHANAGAANVRKADNSNNRPADGFVLEAVTSGSSAEVYPIDGVNNALSGLTPGSKYWLGEAGDVTNVPLDPSISTGKVCQYLGKALSATELITEDSVYVVL